MGDQTMMEHRRLAILRHLADCNGYRSNTSILGDVVNGVGVSTSSDQIIGALSWLADQSLVHLEDAGYLTIVEATAHGVDVAKGRVRHPGVRVPTARR